MKIQFYHGEGSNCCQRVQWILRYKKIPYEAIDCTLLREEEYAAINPYLTAPTLVVDNQVVLESLVQSELLEAVFPQPALTSTDRWENTRIREVCQIMAASIHPLQTRPVSLLACPGASEAEISAYRRKTIFEGLRLLESRLDPNSDFSFGNRFTLADIFIVPLYLKARTASPADQLPRFERILDACRRDPAILSSSPDDMKGLK